MLAVRPGFSTQASRRKIWRLILQWRHPAAGSKRSKGLGMSIEWAEFISFWSNWILIAAGVVATYGIVVSGNVKEAAANSKIVRLTNDTARLSVEAEEARAEIAEADARAVEAQLALEKFKAPRILREEFYPFKGLVSFSGTRFDLSVIPGDPEAIALAKQIAYSLKNSGWAWIEFNHPSGPLMTVFTAPGEPNVGQIGGSGVLILSNSDHFQTFADAAKALADSLNKQGILAGTGSSDAMPGIPNHDTIHIIVGRKTV